ncbi:MAG TPA: DUF4142 domain-containing protein [Spongiibacteraceae bacterium]|nr:DUF4142 domain-containing protein [Spongiibacteraceae bacterium]
MTKLIIAVLSLWFSINAFAQGTTSAAKGTVQSAPAADVMPMADSVDNKAKGRLSDAEFVEKAAIAGLAEVGLSDLALDKSVAKAIREFANAMIKDHSAANQQLRAIAKAKSLSVPQTVDRPHTEILNKLAHLSGNEFDEAYVNVMRQDHDSAIALFENAAGDPAISKELRDFAISTLETLRNHQLQVHNLPIGEIKSAH